MNRTKYQILLTEDALKNLIELCKNMKRILKVIVSLLKDKVSANEESINKKCYVKEIIKKK